MMAIELTDAAFEAAIQRGRERLSKPFATGARYDEANRRLFISFSTGSSLSFDPHKVEILKALPQAAFARASLTPGGEGLVFHGESDADTFAVSLPGLLETIDAKELVSQPAPETPEAAPQHDLVRISGNALLARIAELLNEFCEKRLPAESLSTSRKSSVIEDLRLFLISTEPGLQVQSWQRLAPKKTFAADLLLSQDDEKIVIELKHYSPGLHFADEVSQMERYLRSEQLNSGVLLFLPRRPSKMKWKQWTVKRSNARLVILSPN
jgi:hypothetical protein